MFSCFLIVFFVEFPDQLFKYIPHPKIGKGGHHISVRIFLVIGGQVQIRGDEFFQHIQQHILLRHVAYLGFEGKLFNDFFHVGAETGQIVFHIGKQNLLIVGGGVEQFFQGPLASVVKHISCGILKALVIQLSQAHVIFLKGYLFQYVFFGGFQKRVQAAQYHHGQYHIPVFTPDINISKAVIGNGPDKGYDLVVYRVIHLCSFYMKVFTVTSAEPPPRWAIGTGQLSCLTVPVRAHCPSGGRRYNTIWLRVYDPIFVVAGGYSHVCYI